MKYCLLRQSCRSCILDLSPCISQLSISTFCSNDVLESMNLVRSTHHYRSHANMDNEIQRSPISLTKDDEVKGGKVEATHLESDRNYEELPQLITSLQASHA